MLFSPIGPPDPFPLLSDTPRTAHHSGRTRQIRRATSLIGTTHLVSRWIFWVGRDYDLMVNSKYLLETVLASSFK